MVSKDLIIRPLSEKDYEAWLPLWQGYIAFYEASVPDAITQVTWDRLIDPQSNLLGDVAELDDTVVGFTHSVLHEATWTEKMTCYLEDLYISPDQRRKGIGRALIDNLIARGKEKDWSRVYWHTDANNKTARILYDGYKPADDMVRYRIFLND